MTTLRTANKHKVKGNSSVEESQASSTENEQSSEDEYHASSDTSDDEDDREAESTDGVGETAKSSKRKIADSDREEEGKKKSKRLKSETPAPSKLSKTRSHSAPYGGRGKRRDKAIDHYTIWTKGYEEVDKSLGIEPGKPRKALVIYSELHLRIFLQRTGNHL